MRLRPRSTATILTANVTAPIERVFGVLSDPDKIRQWLPGCRAVSGSELLFRGAWLEVKFGPRTTTFHITDFNPPLSLGWAEQGARRGTTTSFQLGKMGNTTSLRMKQVWTPPSVLAWLRATLRNRRDPKRQLQQTLKNLRRLTGSFRSDRRRLGGDG